jgi:E3 ubiquitin-protein ligase UBR7
MVYNHLRDKVKDFLKPFAESGQAVGAEDIKKYFEGLRGDAEAMRAMRAQQQAQGGDDGGDDKRREQGGY